MTLDQALALARRESPTYADARLDSADARTQFLNGWTSPFNFGTPIGYSSQSTLLDSTWNTARSWNMSVNGGLVLSAATVGGVAQGYIGRELALLRSRSRINQLLYSVKTGYFGLQKVYGLLEVSRDAVKAADDNYRLAEVKMRLGKATGLEVLRAQTNLSQARLNLMNAETGLLAASEAFKATLGIEGDAVIRPEGADSNPPGPAFASLNDYWQAVTEANPGLLVSEQSMKAAELNRTLAYCSVLPSLSASLSYGYSADKLPGSSSPWSDHDATTFGFGVALPLTDWPGRLLGIRSARIAVDRAEVAQRLTEIQTRQSAVSAWLNYEQSSRQVGFAAENLRLNQELYRLGQEQYRLGQITQLDLFTIETGLTQARTSYLNAVSDVHSQQAQIDYLLGR